MTFHHHHKMDGCEWCEGRQSLWGAFVLGLGVFTLGVILILDNFGVIDGSGLVPYWSVLLIILGISHLVGPSSANNLGVIAVGIQVLWPVVLVILGTNLLLCGVRRRVGGYEREGAKR